MTGQTAGGMADLYQPLSLQFGLAIDVDRMAGVRLCPMRLAAIKDLRIDRTFKRGW